MRCFTCAPDDPSPVAITSVAVGVATVAAQMSTATAAEVIAGVAGASARREHDRRSQGRERRIRQSQPMWGGLILALTDDPQTTKAWAVGAEEEERLGRRLDNLAGENIRVLHDRRIPRTRANLDHIVVAP
ncbi:MAG: NERD domain-containing protein [Kineosporiaceae bacterium]|nr:NERD domain-containing protein [Aeromicrobium sp.]